MKRQITLLMALGSLLGQANTRVTFVANGTPSVLTIKGECSRSTVQVQTKACPDGKPCNRLKATVELASCTTGNDLRDRHMREKYLQVSSSPTATLEMEIPINGSGSFPCSLSVHGVDVRRSCEVESRGTGLRVKLTTSLKAHNIETPSFLGVSVKDEVTIEASHGQ